MHLKFEIKIDSSLTESKVIIMTNEVTDEINQLVEMLSGRNMKSIVGFKGSQVILLDLDDVFNIYTEGKKVYARTRTERVQLKKRLYELEDRLAGTSFLRISNSEIVNIRKVKSLDMSISGTISLRFIDGEKTFVSRRYIERIKKYFGI